MRFRVMGLVIVMLAILAAFVAWPSLDLAASGFFYRAGAGFFLGDHPLFAALHFVATWGAKFLLIMLAAGTLVAALRRKNIFGLSSKAWIFLLAGLLIGPGLVANLVMKDHWGRARPREIVEFGGAARFSPALIPADQCARNCSFVSGDGSFGFYLPALAYVVAPKRARRVFWGAMGLGALFGLSRIAAGAHFLSDTVFAAFFMQLVLAMVHAAMFGFAETASRWRSWFFLRTQPDAANS